MAVSHLAVDSSRKGVRKYVNDGDFSELFGARIAGYERHNHGVKFKRDSIVKNMRYPGTLDMECDANYPSGYCDYARLELCGAESAAIMSDTFNPPSGGEMPVLCGSAKALLEDDSLFAVFVGDKDTIEKVADNKLVKGSKVSGVVYIHNFDIKAG